MAKEPERWGNVDGRKLMVDNFEILDIKKLHHSDLDFWTIMETRWRDMDSLSHINHTAYLSYMESAHSPPNFEKP